MEQIPKETSNNEKVWHDWGGYYEIIGEKFHTKNLEIAVTKYCTEKNKALDVGAGNLRDTKFLLDQGFEVVAVDPSPSSMTIAEKIHHPKFSMLSKPAGAIDFEPETFDVVNAQNILFHFTKPQLIFIVENLKRITKHKGVLCANFIGAHDDWVKAGTKIGFEKDTLERLLEGFSIEVFEEDEHDEPEDFAQKKALAKNDPNYKPKHWHHINIIAVKK